MEAPVEAPIEAPAVGRHFDFKWLGLLGAVVITGGIFALHEQIRQIGAYGYPGLFLVALIGDATIILPAPALAVVFAVGSGLSAPLVGLAAGTGSALGELTGYLAGLSGNAIIEHQQQYQRIHRWMTKQGLWVIFVLSVVPNPLFDMAGMAAGAAGIPPWRFLLACWPGKVLKATAAAFLGAQTITLVDLLHRVLTR